jgi:hypothetical protein
MISIAGFLGSVRWYAVRDATFFEATLSCVGFASLLFLTGFELDVVPERFLEDKLLVTAWLIERLNYSPQKLPFSLDPTDPLFIDFIRYSKRIYYLYDEDRYIIHRDKNLNVLMFKYDTIWSSLHIIGACLYITCVTAAIIINDLHEERVAWITGSFFIFFCFMGYLTGGYVPVHSHFRGWILSWNPFLKEPYFMYKLKKVKSICSELFVFLPSFLSLVG